MPAATVKGIGDGLMSIATRKCDDMIRDVTLEEISDGKLYGDNDLVKADTNSCIGCKQVCCQNMGSTIVLDPLDVYKLVLATEKTFEQLMEDNIELNVVDGITLPNLKMVEPSNRCSFLNEDNQCGIHGQRPGICRLFPLGRYWENDTKFSYILQKGECNKDGLAKIKVKKWLGIEELDQYNKYITEWHSYLKQLQSALPGLSDEQIKTLNMYTLKLFYIEPYDLDESGDNKFYEEFYRRLQAARSTLGI